VESSFLSSAVLGLPSRVIQIKGDNSTWLVLHIIGIHTTPRRAFSHYSDITQNLSVRCELASSHGQKNRNALSSICLQNAYQSIMHCKDTHFLWKTLFFIPIICQKTLNFNK